MKNTQQGFTLVELIIVIVILGILAVTAAPRFLDFGGDARTSTLNAVKGSLESAGALTYGKSIIAGQQNEETETVDGIPVVFGYPAGTVVAMRAVMDLDEGDWTYSAVAGSDPSAVAITPDGIDYNETATAACQVLYTESAQAGAKPIIVVQSGGC
jgi:MSHA pilin protein MshA